MKRVAMYLRQSQDRDGTGDGVERQREDVERLVNSRGWKITAEFVDNDVSAPSRKPRPQFTEMMAASTPANSTSFRRDTWTACSGD